MDPIAGEGLGALVMVLVVTAAVLYVAVVYQRRRALLPGPWPWPVVGSLPVLLTPLPYKSLQKLAAKYGGLMYLQLGQKPCLAVSTAAAAKEVFRKHDASFASRPKVLATDVITAVTYRTLSFAPYGSFWRQLRRVANTELFSPGVHSSHESIRKGEIHHIMRVLVDDSRNGKTVNLKRWLTSVTANTMTMMLTNNRYFGSTGVEDQQTSSLNLRCAWSFHHQQLRPLHELHPQTARLGVKVSGSSRRWSGTHQQDYPSGEPQRASQRTRHERCGLRAGRHRRAVEGASQRRPAPGQRHRNPHRVLDECRNRHERVDGGMGNGGAHGKP